MAVLKNRAKMSTSTTGTGTITLGSAESGYQTFADAGVANSDIVRYVIEDDAAWEIGTGTYTSSGTTLTRTVSESSNSDAALNLSGAAVVFVGATAEDILQPSGGTMTGNLALGDSVKATFGTGGDLEIYHDGSNSYISDTSGTGDLWIRGANLRLTDPDGTLFLFGANNANTRLYFAGVQKLTTTSTGTTINGTLNILPSNTIGSYTLPATDGTSGQVLTTNGSGAITFADTAADATKLPLAGGAMTGAITTNSTFDGRDVSADGTKLDFITVTQAVDLDQMETDIAALANGMVYKGNWDASSGSFPGGGSAQTGWFYYVSVAGTVGGVSFAIGDNIVATTDNASASTFAGNWSKHDQTDAVQAVVGLTGSITQSGLLSALNVEDGADVTDTTNVTDAGALMDSEVDADIKTFVLPANTTISTFGASLVDDLTASAAQTTLGLGSFTRKLSETSGTAGSTSGDWMTVASSQSGRHRGEVMVSDAESGDHAFIRIDWLRSYADTTFTVLSCGGHQNRITGVRVLQETADPTYGWKYLQVYVVASSFYRVQTFIPANTSGWTGHTAVTPIVQNTLTGYSVQGAALSGLDTYPLASQQGILAGDDIQTYGDILVGGTVDGVDIAARDAVLTSTTTTANAALPKAGGTMTGDLSFGDNDKAIFGAGSDLQIYHSGATSFIEDVGTGDLVIKGTDLYLRSAGNSNRLYAGTDTRLYYDGSEKIRTTSTGINVTGTVTADSLTVETAQGDISIANSASSLNFARAGINYVRATGASGSFRFITGADDFTTDRITIASNGDISFYEDTGAVAKFFWDASAERLGLTGSDYQFYIHQGSNQPWYHRALSNGKYSIYLNGTGDIMTLDTSGNVGIGNAAPTTALDVTGTVTATSFSGGGIPTLFVESSGTATAPNSSDSVAIGGYAVSSGANSTALGRANAGGTDSFAAAIGSASATYGAQGTGSISIGTLSKATQIAGTAVGYGATSTHQASSAFGTSATTTANNQIALGGSGVTARISGAYTLPAADGTANQVLTTDGSGAVTFATAAGGSSGLPIALSIVFGR